MERALRAYGCAIAWVFLLAATGCGGRAGSPNPVLDTGAGGATARGGTTHHAGGASAGASAAGGVISQGGAPVSFGGLSASGGDLTIVVPPVPSSGGAPSGAAANIKHDMPKCWNPQDMREGGGFVQCGDGHYRRLEVANCSINGLPRPEKVDYQVEKECWYDTDCTAKDHGYCVVGGCWYGCVKDADCGSGEICFCGDPIGKCVKSNCNTNADCDPDSACVSDRPQDGFHCFDPYGECGPGWNNCSDGANSCTNQICWSKVG